MALTLQLVAESFVTSSPTATIFSPPDSSFSSSGQPSLSLLQFHFSSLALSAQNLRALPYGSKIPTMSTGKSLTVTTYPSGGRISLNSVNVNESTLYDDGALIIFAIENFFNPSSSPTQNPRANSCRSAGDPSDPTIHTFEDAYTLLKSRNYSIMAAFLELQLPPINSDSTLTVLAAPDDAMRDHAGNFSEYSSLFHRHVLSCKLMMVDLLNLSNKTSLRTYLEGFEINLTKAGSILMLGDVSIENPDMYSNDWLVIHGLQDSLSVQAKTDRITQDLFMQEETQSDPGEF